MNTLSKIFIIKISATLIFWCLPLILMPASMLESAGLINLQSIMFARMLGWAYLALCLCYFFGLKSSLKGDRAMGPIWVGIMSNAGACLYLMYFGLSDAWITLGSFIQFISWASAVFTLAITFGLYLFGVRGKGPCFF
ncbi:MAG: hypothetical protein A2X86_09395 [Bdellovibrionales bacterium GWA2_49_15]|nr:MAG: hypothetical protein A2X86_09395 [Bdellovibrionales bacterium GWA2_49_15]